MNEHNWFEWVAAGVTAVFAFILRHVWTKADSSVSRTELQAMFDQFRKETRDMHQENKQTLERVHARVDALYEQRVQR